LRVTSAITSATVCSGGRLHVQQIDELVQVAAVRRARQAVHLTDELERVDQRQVPPQLGALAEDHADIQRVAFALARRDQSRDFNLAAIGQQDACQELDRGRLTGGILADVTDALAFFDVKRDVVERADYFGVAPKQPTQAAPHPLRAPAGSELLDQMPCANNRHGYMSRRGSTHRDWLVSSADGGLRQLLDLQGELDRTPKLC
jgi:hypothetical protein